VCELETDEDKQVIDFLKDAVAYLENRIAIVDNKASVLIAVQGVFFASLTYIIKEIFLTGSQSCVNVVSYVVLGGAFVIFVLTVLLLLQTIRPSRRFLGLCVPFANMEVENYVMWFDDEFPTDPGDYSNKISELDISKIRGNYEKVHFITLQLIRNKYGFYRWAAVGMKLLVLWGAIGIAVLAFLK
jgi:hypothetical protein